jgi:hypothetical protein
MGSTAPHPAQFAGRKPGKERRYRAGRLITLHHSMRARILEKHMWRWHEPDDARVSRPNPSAGTRPAPFRRRRAGERRFIHKLSTNAAEFRRPAVLERKESNLAESLGFGGELQGTQVSLLSRAVPKVPEHNRNATIIMKRERIRGIGVGVQGLKQCGQIRLKCVRLFRSWPRSTKSSATRTWRLHPNRIASRIDGDCVMFGY